MDGVCDIVDVTAVDSSERDAAVAEHVDVVCFHHALDLVRCKPATASQHSGKKKIQECVKDERKRRNEVLYVRFNPVNVNIPICLVI